MTRRDMTLCDNELCHTQSLDPVILPAHKSKYKISRYSLLSVKKIGWDSVACWGLVSPNVGPQGS